MTAAATTLPIRHQLHSQGFRNTSEIDLLSAELAKMLKLVAPATMSAEQQALWLASAVEALEGIRVAEVSAVAVEVKRAVSHHQKIVPEIARLVADRRRSSVSVGSSDEINAERIRRGLGAVHWVKRDGRMTIEEEEPRIKPKRHISDRDRRDFKAEDWAELNEHLERMGATARYRSDGTRYAVEARSN